MKTSSAIRVLDGNISPTPEVHLLSKFLIMCFCVFNQGANKGEVRLDVIKFSFY